MKAIIAAGGSGTRLRPLTFSSNKQLLPVLNKPLLFYPFEAILETGIKEIGLVVNETRPAIENLLGDGSRWGVEVSYIDQPKPLGLGHVVKISEEFLDGQPFVFILGDNIFSQGIVKPFNKFASLQPDALLTIIKHKENKRLGVPYFDDQGKLVKVVEKPENPPNEYGVPGLYMFGPTVFRAFEGEGAVKPSSRGELEITDLYTYLLNHDYRVETGDVEGIWTDPGKFDDMILSHRLLMDDIREYKNQATVDADSRIEGKVMAGKGTKINNSQIIGPVHIDENVEINNSVIGPYVAIGSGSVITNTTISDSVVYEQTTIENTGIGIAHSLIGRRVHVGKMKNDKISLFIGDNCDIKTVS